MSARAIKVIGHRGAAGHAPENTFAAFDRGLAMGVDGVETDIRATRDGVLVLLHDATVDRTTDGSGAIAAMAWEEAQRLDAAARFRGGAHEFGAQRIPRLDDFLDRYGGRTTFRLEVKQRARAAGLRVWAWGVKDPETLRRAVASGIGGCTLDYPDWADSL